MQESKPRIDTQSINDHVYVRFSETLYNLDNCMEKADSKDDLPPLTPQNMVLKEIAGDLCEGTSHVGSQAFRRLISHLETTTQRHTGLDGCY